MNDLSSKWLAEADSVSSTDYAAALRECAKELDAEAKRILSLNDADLLGQLIRGVQAGAKLRWCPYGADDSDATMHTATFSLRAFTYNGGGFTRDEDDVRDTYVWCSGIFERWLKVSDIITALDNTQGKHGLDKPMAVIEYKEES